MLITSIFGVNFKMPKELKEFYYSNLTTALENCLEAGYKPMFMPELADARINGKAAWDKWYSTPSVRATGITKQGSKVVVYAHIDNPFSNPANIRKNVEQGLVNGAGIMLQDDFQKLLDAEDNKRVFVLDYNTLKNSGSGVVSIDSALEHPQTIPFLGGRDRAEAYLAKYKEAYNTDKIGVWHSDDLKDSPMGRLIFAGSVDSGGLNGNGGLSVGGRFLGVRNKKVCEADTQKIVMPNLDKILKYSRTFVPKYAQREYEKGLRELMGRISK